MFSFNYQSINEKSIKKMSQTVIFLCRFLTSVSFLMKNIIEIKTNLSYSYLSEYASISYIFISDYYYCNKIYNINNNSFHST